MIDEYPSIEAWHRNRVEQAEAENHPAPHFEGYVVVELPNGERYGVVSDVIAQRIASGEGTADGGSYEEQIEQYEEWRAAAREDPDALVEYVMTEMGWESFSRSAVRLCEPSETRSAMWDDATATFADPTETDD
jgi:hypothetical protein